MLKVYTVKGNALTTVNPYTKDGRAILETASQIAVETFISGKASLLETANKVNLFTRLTGVTATVIPGRDGSMVIAFKGVPSGLATPWAKLGARLAGRQAAIKEAVDMEADYATLPPSRLRERFVKQFGPSILDGGSVKANFATKAELEADPTFEEILLPILKRAGMW